MSCARGQAALTQVVRGVLKPTTQGAWAEGVVSDVGAGGLEGGGKWFMAFLEFVSRKGSVPVAGSGVLSGAQQ